MLQKVTSLWLKLSLLYVTLFPLGATALDDLLVTAYLIENEDASYNQNMVQRSISDALYAKQISIVNFEVNNERYINRKIRYNHVGAVVVGSISLGTALRIGQSEMHSYPVSVKFRAVNANTQQEIASVSKSASIIHLNPEIGIATALKEAIKISLDEVADDINTNRQTLVPVSRKPEPVRVYIPPPSSVTTTPSVAITPVTTSRQVPIESEATRTDCHRMNANLYFSADPFEAKVGETVKMVLCYHITEDDPVAVVEKASIIDPSGKIFELVNEEIVRTSGYWESQYEFQVPTSSPPGEYTITQTLSYLEESFEVEQIVRVRR